MKAKEVLGRNLRLLREQHGLSQAAVAESLHIDPTAVLRIEKDDRDVRVGELLVLASVLHTHPGALLVPPDGETIEVHELQLDAGQVLAWFAGDAAAVSKPQRDPSYFAERGHLSGQVQELLEDLDAMTRAADAGDLAGVLHWAVSVSEQAAHLLHWAHRRVEDPEVARRSISYWMSAGSGDVEDN